MSITLRQLTYFVALAEELNFGRAAARVHVSQPALSMQIKDLEATLRVGLIERRPRDIRLTPAGRDVLARANRVLAEARALESAARRQGLAGRLNIGIIPTVAPYLLPVALTQLRASSFGRDLRVREAPTAVLRAALDDGMLDAIVIATPDRRQDMMTRPLFEDRFLLAGSPGRLAALDTAPETLRPTSLDPEHLLLLDEGHCLAEQALDVCGISRPQTRMDLGASSLTTLCGLVAEGFGLTFLPEIAVRNETAGAPRIALRRFAAPEPARSIALVCRAPTAQEPWVAALAQQLADAAIPLLAAARTSHPPPSREDA